LIDALSSSHRYCSFEYSSSHSDLAEGVKAKASSSGSPGIAQNTELDPFAVHDSSEARGKERSTSFDRAHGERLPKPFRSALHVGDAACSQSGGADDEGDAGKREDTRSRSRTSTQHSRGSGGERKPATEDLADRLADLRPFRSRLGNGARKGTSEGHHAQPKASKEAALDLDQDARRAGREPLFASSEWFVKINRITVLEIKVVPLISAAVYRARVPRVRGDSGASKRKAPEVTKS
jgi:hypothetical protein